MSIFYSVVFEGVDVSKITVDFWDEIFLSFFFKRGGGRDVLDEERPRFLRQTDGGEDFCLRDKTKHKSKRTMTTTVRSLLLLSTRGGKEKEREREGHTTRRREEATRAASRR